MAHPSKNLPKNTYYLDDANGLTAADGKHFFSITALSGGTITVKGGGVFEFVDVSALADDAAAAKYIDPLTGEAFTAKSVAEDSDHGDGHYEAISTHEVDIALSAGQTLFGRFTYVEGNANEEYLVYQ